MTIHRLEAWGWNPFWSEYMLIQINFIKIYVQVEPVFRHCNILYVKKLCINVWKRDSEIYEWIHCLGKQDLNSIVIRKWRILLLDIFINVQFVTREYWCKYVYIKIICDIICLDNCINCQKFCFCIPRSFPCKHFKDLNGAQLFAVAFGLLSSVYCVIILITALLKYVHLLGFCPICF